MMFTISCLNSPEVCVTQTHEQSSTNQGYHKKKASNRGMEHGGVCKEHTEFASTCIANSKSINREGSSFFRGFLISCPNEIWRGGHSGEKIRSKDF